MDPFTIATGTVALIRSVAAITSSITDFTRVVRDADGDLRSICQELNNLTLVLNSLANHAGNLDREAQTSDPLVCRILEVIKDCLALIQELESLIRKYDSGTRRRIAWAIYGKSNVEKLSIKLKANNRMLSFSLEVVNSVTTHRISDDTAATRRELENMRAQINDLMDALQRRGDLPRSLNIQQWVVDVSDYAESHMDFPSEETVWSRTDSSTIRDVDSDVLQRSFEDSGFRVGLVREAEEALARTNITEHVGTAQDSPVGKREKEPNISQARPAITGEQKETPQIHQAPEATHPPDPNNGSPGNEQPENTNGRLPSRLGRYDGEDQGSGSSSPTLRSPSPKRSPPWQRRPSPSPPPLRNIECEVDSIIDRLLAVRGSRPGTQVHLLREEIVFLCTEARKNFIFQPILLELEAPIKVTGTICGQYYDLLRHFEYGGFPPEANYLFLGDYVSKGKQSIETICLLLAYKIKFPENFFLLRGNHECASVNRIYGFYDECRRRYDEKIWKTFTDCFNCMPVAAVIDEKIFCMHGGLSPDLMSFEQIRRIMRPTDIPDCGLLCDLLWSDPDKDITGWSENDRGVSFTFGPDVVSRFCQKHDIDLIVRSHEVVEDGYEFFSARQLVTVFGAPNYCGQYDNAGAMMSVDESLLCSFQILKPAEKIQMFTG